MIGHLLFPAVVLALFFTFIHYQEKLPQLFWEHLPLFFYTLGAVAITVSWHYNRSRFIFIILPLLLLFWSLTVAAQEARTTILLAAGYLLPFHIVLFLLMKERGILSIWGMMRFLFVMLESALVAYVTLKAPELLTPLRFSLFDVSLTTWTTLNDSLIAIGIMTSILLILLVLFHHQMIYTTTYLGIYLFIMAGLHHHAQPSFMALAFTGVIILTFIALLRESYRLAFFDELTNLPGRRALMEDMAKLGRNYALAMVDIDHFKKFNDTYGHDTGDDVLKLVASILAGVGGGGKAYRYGGEEFTLLFPSRSSEQAFEQMEKLREKVASTPFTVRQSSQKSKQKKRQVSVNISAGVVEKKSQEKDPMAVMKRADQHLYKAKKLGRNRVVKG